MKKIKFKPICAAFLLMMGATSCESYFDSVPSNALSVESVFESRILTVQWLSNVYSYLPDLTEQNYTGGEDETRGVWTPASIEGELPWSHCTSNLLNNGTLFASTGYVKNMWGAYYKGIQKANIYMANVDKCPDMEDKDKVRTKAEARALRAIFYFHLFKIYGPAVIVGDKVFDHEGDIEEMMLTRSTVDDYVNYIVDEFDAILQEDALFSHFGAEGTFNSQFAGNITKETVEAVRSQVLLYAASDLFNGNAYYKGMKNPDGTPLFPQERDDNKWRAARDAAKNFIDNNPGFKLVLRTTNDEIAATFADSKPYYSVFQASLGRGSNEEMIFFSTRNGRNNLYTMTPKHTGIQDANSGAGALAASLQFVDLFFTENGLKIEDDPEYFKDPVTDEEYNRDMTERNKLYRGKYDDYDYIPEQNVRIMKQFYNREPRFYLCFTFQNRHWEFDRNKTYNTDFSLNGNSGSGKNGHDFPKSGVLARKGLFGSLNGVDYNIYIRLTEIYLNYAEACAELGEYKEAVDAINLIRCRAGVAEYNYNGNTPVGTRGEPTIELVEADVLGAVRRERLIELAYENHHYFDVRRWGVAGMAQGDGWVYPKWHQGGEGGSMMGFDTSKDLAEGNDYTFYKRKVWEERIFEERMNLFPIPQNEININPDIVQNAGWGQD